MNFLNESEDGENAESGEDEAKKDEGKHGIDVEPEIVDVFRIHRDWFENQEHERENGGQDEVRC